MQLNRSDLRQAIELLIQRLEGYKYDCRFNHGTALSVNDVITCENIIINYNDREQDNKVLNGFDFTIISDGEKIYRGLIDYTSVLYTKQSQKFREKLLMEESISGIITIKKTSGFSYSQIAIILFDKTDTSTWFVSCSDVEEAVSVLLGEFTDAGSMHYSEKVYAENLLPEYYNEEHNAITAVLENVQTKTLEELAEIIPGKSVRSTDYRENGIPYLRARDLQKGTIVNASVCLEPEMTAAFSRQLIQEGDILLTKHFGQRKLALVTEENIPAIASSALFIIRPFGVSENYLYRYLTSNTGNAVFNAQLKKIEKGAVVASIALSDLKKIQVPVYDEDIMQEIEQIDTLTGEKRVEAAIKIIQAVGSGSEASVEKRVYDELVSAGWEMEKLSYQDDIMLENGKRWIPDFSYCLQNGDKVYFEVKKDLTKKASAEWISAIRKILYGSTKCYYVLTTGYYYEVHVTGSKQSLRTLHAPTITDIIDWERGQN